MMQRWVDETGAECDWDDPRGRWVVEHEPYSEWYWTWSDHRWLAPVRALWDFMAHDPIGTYFTVLGLFFVALFVAR